MRTRLLYGILLTFFAFNFSIAQNSDVIVRVKWKNKSYENKLELYNTANDLLITICDDSHCYTPTQIGPEDRYGVKYNLGCVANGNNYYIKLYDIADDGWDTGSVRVKVAGVEVINDDGTGANSAGQTLFFNVSGGDATCNTIPDMDNDGRPDYLDYDDDGDGITDGAENMGEDRFECSLPALDFENGVYDAAASTSAEGTVGAVYRFGNAALGKDVLMEVMELDNTTILNIDDDTVDNATYLQTRLEFTGIGTPGARFKFTIVDLGTTTPSTEIYRINGITWDTDGTDTLQESVIYYNPAAYGTENPTALDVVDLGSNNIQISNEGLLTYAGFSTYPFLRAYYQFIGNSFSMRMQTIKSTVDTEERLFAMSFTQCEFLDFNANALIIITGEDFDGDGKYNHLDLDSDNDGIPDNVEGQPTIGYIPPSLTIDAKTGIDLVYGTGIQVVDTDFDNTPDILDLDTDSDGLLDIEENGMANAIVTFSDGDDDGLDILFEGAVAFDPLDVNDDINTPSTSILPDLDGDVFTGGDVDYRDLFNTNPPASALLDFDGVDDYLSTPVFIDGLSEVTIMAWVKSDSANTTDMTIAGEDKGCKLWLQDGDEPTFSITTAGNPMRLVVTSIIPKDEWHHITGTFSSTTGILKIYLDGELESSYDTGITGALIENTATSNDAFEIGRTSSNIPDQQHFRGAIDEVRVFDTVLTEDQIQRGVYQEIEQNSGNVRGSVIDKDIIDITTNSKVAWNNLIAYYPMTDIVNSKTFDKSNNSKDLYLFNITSVQAQTAPMPYESDKDGNWNNSNTWLHGDVWDIENAAGNKDWSIVRINDDVTTSASHTNLGLIIESGKTLKLNGSNGVNNTWYLELNGLIDLSLDSQLAQGIYSDLVTSATGKIHRRQEGSSNEFWYTYMSSPVGVTAATSLGNDNAATNNTNNTAFTFNTLKEGNGSAVQFTNAYNEDGKLSTRWMYTFLNGITYYDWLHYSPTTNLNPGVGYIHKGTGNPGQTQEYLFEGRPNNGTILIAADDVDGDSGNESQPDVTQTITLVGNPYASAIDAHKFIDDNVGVIEGTLYLWHQWAGSNHILDEYDGGYATLNKMAKIRAYQFVGMSGGANGNQNGILTPRQYIAVGQSFMTEVIADGNIEFNNGQRAFKKETSGESQFFRTSEETEDKQVDDSIETIKLEFKTSNDMSREIVLGFSDMTTTDYDYGYDAKMFDAKTDDMYTTWNGLEMVAQAYPSITSKMEIPLSLNATGIYIYSIKVTEFTNFPKDQAIYLRDNLKGTYHDLRSNKAYKFKSKAGQFNDRFDIVFKSGVYKANQIDNEIDNAVIYFNTNSDKLFVKGLNTITNQLTLTNMLGQNVLNIKDVSTQSLVDGLPLTNLTSGIYIVSLRTDTNQNIDKKIIID